MLAPLVLAQALPQAPPPPQAQAPPPAQTQVVDPADRPPPPPDRPWHWALKAWSPERQHTSFELEYAPVWFRPIGQGDADPTWARGSELAVGARTVTSVLPFLVSLSVRPALRILDSSSFALSLVQTWSVALALGPLEPDVGGGFSMITLDVIRGHWSAEALSPRATAGLWLHFGSFRLGAHAYGEVLWRWFGNESYLLRGIAFELGAEPRRP